MHLLSETPEERRKRLFFESAPPNAGREARRTGRSHFNRVLHDVLMPDSLMPVGPHAEKTMRQVPAEYLAWVQAQPWSARWIPWKPVADYLTRFPLPDDTPRQWPAHIAFVTPMLACQPTKEWHHPEHALLTGHHDDWLHGDKFHTFALGALGLRPQWFDPTQRAYRLTAQRRLWAIREGAAELAHPPQNRVRAAFQRLREDGTVTCTKHCYSSQHEAAQQIEHILTSRRRNRPDYLRAYECPTCGLWHLTRQRLPHEQP